MNNVTGNVRITDTNSSTLFIYNCINTDNACSCKLIPQQKKQLQLTYHRGLWHHSEPPPHRTSLHCLLGAVQNLLLPTKTAPGSGLLLVPCTK